jgi:hypothetical protein
VNPPVNPPMQNVTPVAPTPATPPALAKKPGRRLQILGVVALVLLVFGTQRLIHHENQYESMADAVTKAIAANDMTPVLGDFNAIRRPELQDRARVGNLSNMEVALGAFKSSKEITPANSPPLFHEFTETFANGSLDEKYELDADGKIVKFHIGPPPSTP